jgi:glycosyltransferase involved in cell wall biosynthesis
MVKPRIVIIGKTPPPFIGTAVWFEVLRHSSINKFFTIHWFNVNVHKDFSTLGKSSIRKLWPNIKLYFSFFQIVRTFKPELVLIPLSQTTPGFLKDSIYVWLTPRKSKTVVILHGSNLKNWLAASSIGIKKYFSYSMRNCTAAIVLGRNLRYLFYNWFPEDRIFVISNGENFDFSKIQKNSFDKVNLRFFGNLSKAKGIREVISSMDHLGDSHSKIMLRINGTWLEKDTENWCLKKVSKSNLPVVFEGPKTGKDKLEALANSDIFIFTPVSPEGHPFVLIEAMAAGLPIISTDQGAITESVLNNVNGFIVNSNAPEEIAEKIQFLVNNPEDRIRMGKESRRIYEENFTEDKMAQRFKSVFTQILNS